VSRVSVVFQIESCFKWKEPGLTTPIVVITKSRSGAESCQVGGVGVEIGERDGGVGGWREETEQRSASASVEGGKAESQGC